MKKRGWADYEQLLRPVFHFFGVEKEFLDFFENTIASALKSCMINFFLDPEKVKEPVFLELKI